MMDGLEWLIFAIAVVGFAVFTRWLFNYDPNGKTHPHPYEVGMSAMSEPSVPTTTTFKEREKVKTYRLERGQPRNRITGYQPIGDGRIPKVPKNDGSGESKPRNPFKHWNNRGGFNPPPTTPKPDCPPTAQRPSKTCSHCGKATPPISGGTPIVSSPHNGKAVQ